MENWTQISCLLIVAGVISLSLYALEQLDPLRRGENLLILGWVMLIPGCVGLAVRWLA